MRQQMAQWENLDEVQRRGYYPVMMIATNSDARRRVTFPADLKPRSPVVIDTLEPGRAWIVRVPAEPRRVTYSRGRVLRDKNGLRVWTGDVGEEPADAVVRQRRDDDRARE